MHSCPASWRSRMRNVKMSKYRYAHLVYDDFMPELHIDSDINLDFVSADWSLNR